MSPLWVVTFLEGNTGASCGTESFTKLKDANEFCAGRKALITRVAGKRFEPSQISFHSLHGDWMPPSHVCMMLRSSITDTSINRFDVQIEATQNRYLTINKPLVTLASGN